MSKGLWGFRVRWSVGVYGFGEVVGPLGFCMVIGFYAVYGITRGPWAALLQVWVFRLHSLGWRALIKFAMLLGSEALRC